MCFGYHLYFFLNKEVNSRSKFRVRRLVFESRSMSLAFLSENGRVLDLKIIERIMRKSKKLRFFEFLKNEFTLESKTTKTCCLEYVLFDADNIFQNGMG